MQPNSEGRDARGEGREGFGSCLAPRPSPLSLSSDCPAYQEEGCLPFFHQELTAVLDHCAGDFAV